ncbi:HAD-IA family hydrolase [Halorarum salinum]|uniref:HAD-IA family hydrolase n=1 Tax=Halorarum salinum TaxID=2743089 RepID=A0A7D5Q901_9EURY|nr:HAD-IA family hydrolase [Halobaculum salinum]QLG60319.1 HAD-IA family hydrolase [Halobaculum salinum]
MTGAGEGAYFVRETADELAAELGFRPYSGTLNVDSLPLLDELPSKTAMSGALVTEHCDGVVLRACSVSGVRSAVIRPLMDNYPDGKVELVAPVRLRALFGFDNGDEVPVSPPDDIWHPDAGPTDASELDGFDAVVFDLDGTLVDLDVDWGAARDDIKELLDDILERSLTEYSRADVLRIARKNGHYDELDRLLTEYESEGARTGSRLPLVTVLSTIGCSVGICTANAPSVAEQALESHGTRGDMDAIVGRGTVSEEKPHPEPLEHCLDRLDADPGNSVFVGDERTDAEAAAAAGSSFLHPAQFD